MRLMLYDRTCTTHFGGRLPVGLTHAWQIGARYYRGLGRLDAWKGITSWTEGLRWLASHDAPIHEVQFWGHGRWGRAMVGADALSAASLRSGHEHHELLTELRSRLAGESPLWWFRTCETLGTTAGHDFSQRFADHLGCDVAGHTFVIADWHSGLHRLKPGAQPHWSPSEGLADGTPDRPVKALWSMPWMPNTIHMLSGAIPEGW